MHTTEGTANVPSFITKLWKLVNEKKYSALITWSPDGRSFTITDQTRFSKELLPLYFKHSNMGSFVRQLNMYGFRKMTNIENCGLRPESDDVSFHHPDFVRGEEHLLQVIRRKKNPHNNNNNSSDSKGTNGHQASNGSQAVSVAGGASDVQTQLVTIMQRQEALDKFRLMIQQENAAIWKEIAFLRRQNNEQQNVIQNLIKFLISLVPQMRNMSGKRKASLISSMTNSMPDSKRLNTGSSSSSSSGGMDSISLDTIRNGIMDAIRNGLSNSSESAASPTGVTIQDVTNEEADSGPQAPTPSTSTTLIPHSSNAESAPILTDSDLDLLSSICKQLNLVPTSSKKNSVLSRDTVPAQNITEVAEDFTLVDGDDVVPEADFSELVENAEDLLFPTEGIAEPAAGTDAVTNCDPEKNAVTISLPDDAVLDQPLNDPLDLDSLDLGVDGPDEFVLSDPLAEDSDNFSLLL